MHLNLFVNLFLLSYRKLFYDGKHSMQTRGLLVLLTSKAAGETPNWAEFSELMVSGIYPRFEILCIFFI